MICQAPVLELIEDPHDTCREVAAFAERFDFDVQIHRTPADLLASYAGDRPGCLIADLHLAGCTCLDLHEELRNRDVALPMIVVTAHGTIRVAVQAIRAGIFDFYAKPVTDAALRAAIHAAVEHRNQVLEERAAQRERSQRLASLTRRERQVLRLVVLGMLNKQIAAKLGISPKTVEIHRANLMEKMGATHVTDLVRMVLSANSDEFPDAAWDTDDDRQPYPARIRRARPRLAEA